MPKRIVDSQGKGLTVADLRNLCDGLPSPDALPGENEQWTVYRDFLKSLRSADLLFERSKGYLSWIQGTVLNLCVESSLLRKGQYARLLDHVGMKRATAYNCRRIAQSFTSDTARRYGYTQLLHKIAARGPLWDRVDLVRDAPEHEEDDLIPAPQSPKRQENGAPPKMRPVQVTYDNVKSHLRKLGAVVNAILTMPDPKVELRDARATFELIRTECESLRGALRKVMRRAEQKIEMLSRASHAA